MSVHKHEQPGAQQQAAAPEELTWQAAQTEDVDDILDQIDSVLEVNAEEFVRSFVQKGGE